MIAGPKSGVTIRILQPLCEGIAGGGLLICARSRRLVRMSTILLVEDNKAILTLFAMVLEERYAVLAASNGTDGLRLFEQNHVDIIITDLSMPGFDGFALIRAVRATGKPVKIVACSALINQGNVRQLALEVGADACLTKPVDLPVLEQTIADLLAGERSQASN